MRYVYLAGPIKGCTHDEAVEWRDWVKVRLLPGIVGVSPMRHKDFLKDRGIITGSYEEDPLSSRKGISARDQFDVRKVDMILAYMPLVANGGKVSVGTLMELGIAKGIGTPTVVVSDHPDVVEHPLVHEWCSWVLPTLELGLKVVNGVLGAYEPMSLEAYLQHQEEIANGKKA